MGTSCHQRAGCLLVTRVRPCPSSSSICNGQRLRADRWVEMIKRTWRPASTMDSNLPTNWPLTNTMDLGYFSLELSAAGLPW